MIPQRKSVAVELEARTTAARGGPTKRTRRGWRAPKGSLAVLPALVMSGLFVCHGDCRGDPLSANSQAALFKEFVQHPPTIESLGYTQEVPGLTTNYFDLKYQPPALFLGRITVPFPAHGGPTTAAGYTEWVARFGHTYLNKSYNMLFAWTNAEAQKSASNTVNLHYTLALDQAAKILNMGCQFLPPGGIRWNGNRFTQTNTERGVWVEGHLVVENNAAVAMSVVPHALGSTTRQIVPSEYRYTYDRRAPLSLPYLPNVITESFTQENGSAFRLRYRLLRIELARGPMGESAFLPSPQTETNLVHVTISNGFRVYPAGVVRPDIGLVGRSRSRLTKYYLACAAVVLLLPPVIYFVKNRSSIKHERKE